MRQARETVISQVKTKLAELPRAETPEYKIHPPALAEPYTSRYQHAASLMYAAGGIARDDVIARQRHLAR
jgi:hypothetical protein